MGGCRERWEGMRKGGEGGSVRNGKTEADGVSGGRLQVYGLRNKIHAPSTATCWIDEEQKAVMARPENGNPRTRDKYAVVSPLRITTGWEGRRIPKREGNRRTFLCKWS